MLRKVTKYPFKEIAKKSLPSPVIEWTKNVFLHEVDEKHRPSDTVLSEARAYLKADVDRLRSLTGKSFDKWSL
jgi:hypothetical protein